MGLRGWLYSRVGLWLGGLLLLLPPGLLMLALGVLVYGRRAQESTLALVVIVLLNLAQVVCWAAVVSVARYRGDRFRRRPWLLLLAPCVLLHGLLALLFLAMLIFGKRDVAWVLMFWPLLESLWVLLLVLRVNDWGVRALPVSRACRPITDTPTLVSLSKDELPSEPPALRLSEVVVALIVGLLAAGLAFYGVLADDLLIPSKRGTTHVHGLAVWPLALAFLCAFAAAVSMLREYRDPAPDRRRYRLWRRRLGYVGWSLLVGGFVFSLVYGGASDH